MKIEVMFETPVRVAGHRYPDIVTFDDGPLVRALLKAGHVVLINPPHLEGYNDDEATPAPEPEAPQAPVPETEVPQARRKPKKESLSRDEERSTPDSLNTQSGNRHPNYLGGNDREGLYE